MCQINKLRCHFREIYERVNRPEAAFKIWVLSPFRIHTDNLYLIKSNLQGNLNTLSTAKCELVNA